LKFLTRTLILQHFYDVAQIPESQESPPSRQLPLVNQCDEPNKKAFLSDEPLHPLEPPLIFKQSTFDPTLIVDKTSIHDEQLE